jgi:hypothetical protein
MNPTTSWRIAAAFAAFMIGCGSEVAPADGGTEDSGAATDGGGPTNDGGSEPCVVPPGGSGAPLGDGGPCQSSSDCGGANTYCHLPVVHCEGYDFWVAGFASLGDCRPQSCQISADCAADEACNAASFCVPDPCPADVTGVTCLCANPGGNWPYPACDQPPQSTPYGGCPPGCTTWYTPTGAQACRCAPCPDPDAGYLTHGC